MTAAAGCLATATGCCIRAPSSQVPAQPPLAAGCRAGAAAWCATPLSAAPPPAPRASAPRMGLPPPALPLPLTSAAAEVLGPFRAPGTGVAPGLPASLPPPLLGLPTTVPPLRGPGDDPGARGAGTPAGCAVPCSAAGAEGAPRPATVTTPWGKQRTAHPQPSWHHVPGPHAPGFAQALPAAHSP